MYFLIHRDLAFYLRVHSIESSLMLEIMDWYMQRENHWNFIKITFF